MQPEKQNCKSGSVSDALLRDVGMVKSCFGMMDEVTVIRGSVPTHDYPPPPDVYYARDRCTGQHHPAGPGVYFVFDRRGVCKYVGKSENIKKRLQGHPRVDCAYDFIAWIEFPIETLDYAECYYIGLMKPYANFNGACPEFNPFDYKDWILFNDASPAHRRNI